MSKQNRLDQICTAYLAARLRIERLPNGDSVSTCYSLADVPEGETSSAFRDVATILSAFPVLYEYAPSVVGASFAEARHGHPGFRELLHDADLGVKVDAEAAAMGVPPPIFGEVR